MYMNNKIKLAYAGALVFGATLATASAPNEVTRTVLQQHDLSISGREVVHARIDIAPGGRAPWHRHPGEEVIYVVEGVLEYQLEGQPSVVLEEGEVLFIPDGVAHRASNPGTINGAELATYIVRKGEPLVVPASGHGAQEK